MFDAQQLAESFVAVWNEADDNARRRTIAALWAPDGLHLTKTREARGYEALEARVVGSYQRSVRDLGRRFYAEPGALAVGDAVTFFWQMRPAGGDQVLARGVEFLIVDGEGRIRVDYQFNLE